MHASAKICASLAALFVVSAEASDDSAWEQELTVVLWASGLEGRESLGPLIVNVDASFSDLLEFVNAGGALRYVIAREPVAWFMEASYVELENDATSPIGRARVELGQTIAEGGLSVEIAEQFALYGGARYQALDLEIQQLALGSIRRDTDWIDAIAGFRWTPIEENVWHAWLRADVGAGGADFQWLAEAGIALRFASMWSASVAYRTLDVDYESGRFRYDMRQSGVLLGIGVRF